MSPRTLLAAAVLALPALAPAAQAQTTFGLTAGLNVATLSGDDAPDGLDPRLGFSGGVFANVPIGYSGAFVQPEVRYSMKGAADGSDDSNSDATLAIDYIEVPVLLGYATPVTQSGLMLGAYAGPSVGFKVRESLDVNSGVGSGSIDSDVIKSLDVGAAVGATVGAGPFGIDARYTFGLTNILDSGSDSDLRNGAFTIGATYRFGGTGRR